MRGKICHKPLGEVSLFFTPFGYTRRHTDRSSISEQHPVKIDNASSETRFTGQAMILLGDFVRSGV